MLGRGSSRKKKKKLAEQKKLAQERQEMDARLRAAPDDAALLEIDDEEDARRLADYAKQSWRRGAVVRESGGERAAAVGDAATAAAAAAAAAAEAAARGLQGEADGASAQAEILLAAEHIDGRTEPLKQGVLKMGGVGRWFELRAGCKLFFYKTASGADVQGCVLFEDSIVVSVDDETTAGRYCFDVITPERLKYRIDASSKAVRDEWMDAVLQQQSCRGIIRESTTTDAPAAPATGALQTEGEAAGEGEPDMEKEEVDPEEGPDPDPDRVTNMDTNRQAERQPEPEPEQMAQRRPEQEQEHEQVQGPEPEPEPQLEPEPEPKPDQITRKKELAKTEERPEASIKREEKTLRSEFNELDDAESSHLEATSRLDAALAEQATSASSLKAE
eukprot:COSAG02_NODE_8962_length_2380_cov_40.535292_2_plen_388_part_01